MLEIKINLTQDSENSEVKDSLKFHADQPSGEVVIYIPPSDTGITRTVRVNKKELKTLLSIL